MQLNFKKFPACVLFVLSALIFTYAQTEPPIKIVNDNPPSSADVMRDRITKAKAHIVVKNYNAAIYELENIQRETSDPALNSVINVLLMHSYLEQTDYKRAQEFLAKFHKDMKSNNAFAATNYYAVAGQIVKGARNQLERYRGIGLNVADRNLPLEALVDIDKMRETLEIVVSQTKELGEDKKQNNQAMPLLEEATNARVALAKDDYDANRWKREVAEAREMLVDSRSTVINAVDGKPIVEPTNTVAGNNTANTNKPTASNNLTETANVSAKVPENTPENTPAFNPVAKTDTSQSKSANPVKAPETPKETPVTETKPQEETIAENTEKPKNKRNRIVIGDKPTEEEKKKEIPRSSEEEKVKEKPKTQETIAQTDNSTDAKPADDVKPTDDNSPLEVGSLVEYATKRVNPVYPSMARSIRQSGIVKVEFIIDEEGKVAEINNTSGPSMLQRAATDALKKWQFKPFLRDGVPVKAVGFVNFNFSL